MKLATPLESVVHRQVCDYVRLKWPDAIFNSDGAGNNLSRAQAGMAKMLRCSAGFPDWFLAQPMGRYHGLFLELKREGVKLCLKDGCALVSHEHIHQQEYMLEMLQKQGYAADFAVGVEEAIMKIDWYMALKSTMMLGAGNWDKVL